MHTDRSVSLAPEGSKSQDCDFSTNQQGKGYDASRRVGLPDGQVAPLTYLCEGQQATILQLPAEPKTLIEFEAQRRVAHVD